MMKRTLETQTEIQGPGFDPASDGATLAHHLFPLSLRFINFQMRSMTYIMTSQGPVFNFQSSEDQQVLNSF